MFRQILSMQWRASRLALVMLLPLCLALPILSLRVARMAVEKGESVSSAVEMLVAAESSVVVFPVLAVIVGATIALCAWMWDHRTHHIYALSLPIERWRYVLMKMGAGALVLLVPTAAILIGAVIATSGALPDGIHRYPFAFTMRFLLASLVCYALTFAFASGTMRTTVYVLSGLVVLLVFGSAISEYLSSAFGFALADPSEIFIDALGSWPGPFSVFSGNWMLIDV